MNKVLEFWNSRAENYGTNAGSNDFLLKKLEIKNILNLINNDSCVLDIGCGNGDTLAKICDTKNCTGVGVDFSDSMIKTARERHIGENAKSDMKFIVDALPILSCVNDKFDYVLTERCLINLQSEPEQIEAFNYIMSCLKPGGKYIMVESFIEGLDRINKIREWFSLYEIKPPWHNNFLKENHVKNWGCKDVKLKEIIHFSSSYYYMSRVVYAKLARDNNEELRYDSELNKLGAELPPFGEFGPAKIYVWEKI